MDQSNRYADLTLREEDLISGGKHVLCAYIMKPKAGFGTYLETAAHFAAESSTGTNVEVSTTDEFTRGIDALVYEIDEEKEIMKIAYPTALFDRNIIDGRAMLASFLTLTIGNNQGMGDVEYAKMYDFWMPPEYLRLHDGPSTDISAMTYSHVLRSAKDCWKALKNKTASRSRFSKAAMPALQSTRRSCPEPIPWPTFSTVWTIPL